MGSHQAHRCNPPQASKAPPDTQECSTGTMSQQNSQKEYSTPVAWVKTTNPEYKEYSARLNRVKSNDFDSKGMQASKEVCRLSKQLQLTKNLSPYCQILAQVL